MFGFKPSRNDSAKYLLRYDFAGTVIERPFDDIDSLLHFVSELHSSEKKYANASQ